MRKKTITVESDSPLDSVLSLNAMSSDLTQITQLLAKCHLWTQSVFLPFLAKVKDEIDRNIELVNDETKGGAA